MTAKLNPAKFRNSFVRFTAGSRRKKGVVLRQQAKLGTRDAVKVTPPNKNWAYNRQGGERAVETDIRKIFRPSRKGITDPASIHQKYRNRSGRVTARLNTATEDKRILVAGLTAYIRKVKAKVGILAAGWASAAAALGQTLPSWITRHGSRFGRIRIRINDNSGSITIINAVRYAGDVRGLVRRLQWVLDNRSRQMEKQMQDQAVRKAAREAGLQIA